MFKYIVSSPNIINSGVLLLFYYIRINGELEYYTQQTSLII